MKIVYKNSPGIFVSFSVSLFCAEPNGEPDILGEWIVGDIGVAEPENEINIYYKINTKIQRSRLINYEQ